MMESDRVNVSFPVTVALYHICDFVSIDCHIW